MTPLEIRNLVFLVLIGIHGKETAGSQKRPWAFEQCFRHLKAIGAFRDWLKASYFMRWKGDLLGQDGTL